MEYVRHLDSDLLGEASALIWGSSLASPTIKSCCTNIFVSIDSESDQFSNNLKLIVVGDLKSFRKISFEINFFQG